MSFDLALKNEYSDGNGGYYWKYSPIEDLRAGWKKVFDVIEALERVGENLSIDIEGPDHNEKEFGDIGWKDPEDLNGLRGMLDELVRDKNYSGSITFAVNGDGVLVRFQIIEVGKYIGFLVVGELERVRFVSTVIKKALE